MRIAALVVVGSILLAGCGESDGKKPASMGEVGAAIERQAAAGGRSTVGEGTPTSSQASGGGPAERVPPASAGAAGTESSSASPSAPAAVDPSIASKRGYALTDLSNEAAYVLVKADVNKTAEALAKALNGQVVKDMYGKKTDFGTQTIVYQLAGHPWSIFACSSEQLEELAPALSREADVLTFWSSDFTGWEFVDLYRGGAEVEALHHGDPEARDSSEQWQTEATVTSTYEDGVTIDDVFLFRSKLRQVPKEELQKGEAFVDAMFKHHDAYLPDLDEMAWGDESDIVSSSLGKGAFAGVVAVEVK